VSRALIVSISNYLHDDILSLPVCEKDGKDMYNLFSSIGYEISDNHRLISEVEHASLRDAIADFFLNASPQDTLVFYYSGHGILNKDGEAFLALSEIDPKFPEMRGMPLF
jgi:hypothetical protein